MIVECPDCRNWRGGIFAICPTCDNNGEIELFTFGEYNEETLKTSKYPSMGENILYPVTGLLEEAGEVAGVIKKAQRTMNLEAKDKIFVTGGNGKSYITPSKIKGKETLEKLLDECGDVLWYLNRVVVEAGSSLEEVAKRNIAKVQKRLAEGTLLATEKRVCARCSGTGESLTKVCPTCGGSGK